MVPAVVMTTGALTRLGSVLGRVSPQVMANVINALRAAGHSAQASAKSVVDLARANPGAAATVLTTLVSAGVFVSDLFDKDDKADPATRAAVGVLAVAEAQGKGYSVPAGALKAAAASETLKTGLAGRREDTFLLKEVVGFAKRHFGGRMNALEAHAMMQAFFELPLEDVEYAFDNLRLS